jgi:DNA-binding IclR family transcriptional regulator
VAVPLFTHSRLLVGALSIAAPVIRADVARLSNLLMAASRRLAESNFIN